MTSNGDYPVGYGKPPLHSQFPKGKSGNPKGRPKRPQEAGIVAVNALNEIVSFQTHSGRKMRITLREKLIRVIFEEALNGNSKSMKTFFDLMKAHDGKF